MKKNHRLNGRDRDRDRDRDRNRNRDRDRDRDIERVIKMKNEREWSMLNAKGMKKNEIYLITVNDIDVRKGTIWFEWDFEEENAEVWNITE